jgi:energy-coupling factor transport system permease protein
VDLVHGAMKLKLPYKAGYILIIAFRFLPTMAREARQIVEAQMSRGLDLQKGSIFNRAKNYIPIFIPLMVRMVKMTVELGIGMESRCFGSKPKRTFLKELKFEKKDRLFSVFYIFSLFLVICLWILGYGQIFL